MFKIGLSVGVVLKNDVEIIESTVEYISINPVFGLLDIGDTASEVKYPCPQ